MADDTKDVAQGTQRKLFYRCKEAWLSDQGSPQRAPGLVVVSDHGSVTSPPPTPSQDLESRASWPAQLPLWGHL